MQFTIKAEPRFCLDMSMYITVIAELQNITFDLKIK